jgi:Tol biopolymer transport system component/tRNA A-37 threonylcarbamoyl transferase component Bud32
LPLLSGSTLASYQILGPLGAGAMGEVYRAKDTRLGREVAIKILPEHFADDAERLKRFEREAKTLASLNHPNVAQIFGVDQAGNTCFLVLELVPGESLEERLRKGAMPLDEAVEVCAQIALGLEAAHEAGVIHRDLKPANVRLTPDGKVKVLDFGLAKPARESHTGSSTDSVLSTEAGRLLGTPTYMAPEQARGKPIDKRVDVWAFGCVLYECLTAKRAFAGETLTDVFAAVIEREPDWSSLPASTPARVRDVLRNCLAKDPRQRLHDVADARIELVRAGAGSESTPGASVDAARTSKRALAAVALLAFVLGALGAWLAIPRASGPRPVSPSVLRLSIALPESPHATGAMALSPDGKSLAYGTIAKDATAEEIPQVWLRRIDSFQSTRLEAADGARAMCFSPDGSWIAFVCSIPGSAGGTRLKKASLGGGPAITLCEDRAGDYGAPVWSAPASIEFARFAPNGDVASVSSDGGEPKRLFELPWMGSGELYAGEAPGAVPGTDAMLLSLPVTDAKGWRIRTQLFSSSSAPRVLIDDGAFAQCPLPGVVLYASGDTLLARRLDSGTRDWIGGPVPVLSGLRTTQGYPSSLWKASASCLAYLPGGNISGKRQLATLDPNGRIEPYPNAVGDFEASAIPSPDGSAIAGQWVTTDGNYEIYVYDVAGKTVRRLPVRGADCSMPMWSRDGKQLYHALYVTGQPTRVVVRRADGMDSPRTIFEMDVGHRVGFPVGESADGRSLIVVGGAIQPELKLVLLRVPLDGKEKPVTWIEGVSNQVAPAFSPDGKLLVYGRIDQGMSELILRSVVDPGDADGARTGDDRVVAQIDQFTRVSWSSDGKRIAYAAGGERLMELEVSTEPSLSVSRPRERVKLDSPNTVSSAPLFVPGTDKMVFIQAAPEESRIAQVNVVLNWYEELRDKLPPAPSR